MAASDSRPEKVQDHPNTPLPLRPWRRLLREHRDTIPPHQKKRVRRLLVGSAMMEPIRLLEKVRYGRLLARTQILEPPVFIVGHARSGTTYLHYLLSRDPQFGFVSLFQTTAPTFCLVGRGWIKRFMARTLDPKRPMDDVTMSMDYPQEEEFGLSNSCEFSIIHGFSFPSKLREHLERGVFLRGLTAEEQGRWERALVTLMKKGTIECDGRPLVMKSPTNTGRIPHLLRLFPEAKFIHIVRNPCEVYPSTVHTLNKMLDLFLLEDHPGQAVIADFVAMQYRLLMRKYLEDRSRIPAVNLVEVRYEDLLADPLSELQRVYETLRLPGWQTNASSPVARYVASLAGFRTNVFDPDPEAMRRIAEEWRFAFDEWGYPLPDEEDNPAGGREGGESQSR